MKYNNSSVSLSKYLKSNLSKFKLFVIFLVLVVSHISQLRARFIFHVTRSSIQLCLKLKLNEEKYIAIPIYGEGNKFFTLFHFTNVTTRFQKTVIITSSRHDFNPFSIFQKESRVKSNLIRLSDKNSPFFINQILTKQSSKALSNNFIRRIR